MLYQANLSKIFSNFNLWKAKCTKFCVLISSAVLASDDSSDDEPLIKMKTTAAKKSEKNENTSPRSNGTNKKNTGLYITSHISSVLCWIIYGVDSFKLVLYVTFSDLKTDDSSDNEPLMEIAKAAKKSLSVPPKKSVDTKKKGKIVFCGCTWSINRKLLLSV